jgi:hypothetical protein
VDCKTIDKIDEDIFRIAQILYYKPKDFYIIPIKELAKDLEGKVCFLKTEIRLMLSKGFSDSTLDSLIKIKRIFRNSEICEPIVERPNFMV